MDRSPFSTVVPGDPAADNRLPSGDPATEAQPRLARDAPARSSAPIDTRALLDSAGSGVSIVRDEISRSRRNHELFFDMVADAAFLAGHQVQWIELGTLTERPEYTATDFFAEVALTFLPYGQLINGAAKTVLTGLVDKVLKTRMAFSFTGLSSTARIGLGTELRDHAVELAKQEAQLVSKLGSRARRPGEARQIVERFLVAADDSEWTKHWRDYDALHKQLGDVTHDRIRNLISKPTEIVVEDFLKKESNIRRYYMTLPIELIEGGVSGMMAVTIGPNGRPMPKVLSSAMRITNQTSARPDDSAIVGVMSEIVDFAHHQKATQNLCFDEWESRSHVLGARVVTDPSFSEDLLKYLRSLRIPLPANGATVKNSLIRYFEACMWAQIYPLGQEKAEGQEKTKKDPKNEINKVIPEKVLNYLINRLYPVFPTKGQTKGQDRELTYYQQALVETHKSGFDEILRLLAAERGRSLSDTELYGKMEKATRIRAVNKLADDLAELRTQFGQRGAQLLEMYAPN
jgi:hypothetical protein